MRQLHGFLREEFPFTARVESHFTAKTVGGATVYDLTSPKAGP